MAFLFFFVGKTNNNEKNHIKWRYSRSFEFYKNHLELPRKGFNVKPEANNGK